MEYRFSDANKALTVITTMQQADVPRANNRARIDLVFNGNEPYTPAEVQQGRIDTNVNFLEGPNIAHSSRLKLYTALLGDERLFNIKFDQAPPEMKGLWEEVISEEINRKIKSKLCYFEEQRNKIASLVLHGVAPMVWSTEDCWYPKFASLEDWKVPGRTLVTLENMDYYAVYRRYTPYELYCKVFGEYAMAGWNKEFARQLIKSAIRVGTETAQTSTYYSRPEELEQDMKANSGYYMSDVIATVNTWELYCKNDDGSVSLQVIPVADSNGAAMPERSGDGKTMGTSFLFKKLDWAKSFDHTTCVHFCDGNSVAPFRVHTVRSVGYLLYALCHLQNRLRSKLMDATFENLLHLWRKEGGMGDGETLPAFFFQNYGIVPNGYGPITQQERHQINEPLVGAALGQNRQLMSENSASYTQDLNQGGGSEETATAVIARVNASSSLLNGMLTMAFTYQEKEYREICRRFTRKNSTDYDVKDFQKVCIERGVPKEMLDAENWKVRCTKPVGVGDKTLEMLQMDKLMNALPMYDESAQRKIKRMFTKANVDDPELALDLVPIENTQVTPAQEFGTLSMGTLMQGIPIAVPETIAHGELAQTWLMLSGQMLQQIEQEGSMATKEQIRGLFTVYQEVQEQIEIISQDKSKANVVKILSDQAAKLLNALQGYKQRLDEQGDQGNMDPAVIETQSKVKLKEFETVKKEERADFKFQAENNRRDANTLADIQRKRMLTVADIENQALKADVEQAA